MDVDFSMYFKLYYEVGKTWTLMYRALISIVYKMTSFSMFTVMHRGEKKIVKESAKWKEIYCYAFIRRASSRM